MFFQEAICSNHDTHSVPLNNAIDSSGDEVTDQAKCNQASRDAEEPGQVAFVFLAGNPDVHTPHTCDDVHGQDDCSKNCQFAENVGVLLGALVHANVDLGDVVAVSSTQETEEDVSILQVRGMRHTHLS